MKKIRINKQFLILIICLVSILAFDSKSQGAPQDLNLTVSGEKAIERLEQDGSSNSLIRAVKTDRRKNEPSQEESLTAQETKLFGDGTDGANFGISVVVSGNTAIVGSPNATVGGNNKGAAYIYIQSGGIWTLQQRITASDASFGAGFGRSVDIKGDTAVVGAFCANRIGPDLFCQGAAYVFIRTGTVWTQQQKLTASDNIPGVNSKFSSSVALGNDTVVVCAPGAAIMQLQGESGAAYIYTRSYPPSGPIWTEQ